MLVRTRESELLGAMVQNYVDLNLVRRLGMKNILIMDESRDLIPGIRTATEDVRIYLRLRKSDPVDMFAAEPKEWARYGNDLARAYLKPTDRLTPGNEPNLDYETGGRQRSYNDIAWWCAEFALEWRRLGAYCPIVTPAVAPGHSEDQEDTPGVIGFKILKAAWDLFDIIGLHCYWPGYDVPGGNEATGLINGADMGADPAYFAFRMLKAFPFWPDKTFAITEFNAPNIVQNEGRWQAFANAVNWYIQRLAGEQFSRLEAVIYFLLSSKNQPYQADCMPPLLKVFEDTGNARMNYNPPVVTPPTPTKPVPPAPAPKPTGPRVTDKWQQNPVMMLEVLKAIDWIMRAANDPKGVPYTERSRLARIDEVLNARR